MDVIITIAVIAFFIFCAWLGWALWKLQVKQAKRDRARSIERSVRQEIEDAATLRRVAAKILRERGEQP